MRSLKSLVGAQGIAPLHHYQHEILTKEGSRELLAGNKETRKMRVVGKTAHFEKKRCVARHDML